MKWPESLTVVRHGESAYNALKAQKEADPVYQEFRQAFEDRATDPGRARALAEKIIKLGSFVLNAGDHDTALTDHGQVQAEVTGQRLHELIELPDVILVSPYQRAHHTLDGMMRGWPELADVKEVEEERLREQEHGTSILYNDWRIFHILHPEQEALYYAQGPYWYRYPQGENVPDVRERMRSLLTTITRDYHEQNVLMVGHHLSILALRANLERLDAHGLKDLDDNHKPINCGVTVYRGDPDQGEDGKLLLDIYNQKLY